MKILRNTNKTLKVLTWHIHGSYLYYLTQTPCEFYLPVKDNREEGYGGRSDAFPWGENVFDIPIKEIQNADFDCILFQSRKNYLHDQFEILSEVQRKLPKIFLEHDPPRESPTDTKHMVDDPDMLLVHVTDFNRLMWDNNRTPSKVIRHGVMLQETPCYSGHLNKGIVVINGLGKRGRRLGLDIFRTVKQQIPLDLVGMGSEEVGGIGEIPLYELPDFMGQYRFFFNPIRYTSLGLAVCEAMMAGMPVIGLATTEMSIAIKNGLSGYVHTNVDLLIGKMQELLKNPDEAAELSKGARAEGNKQFNINRFAREWMDTFEQMVDKNRIRVVANAGGTR